MRILMINGPNLNLLGLREPDIYGTQRLQDLEELITTHGEKLGVSIKCLQSNHEGELVDWIQMAFDKYDAILINPAAYTHTSIAILDALKAVGLPAVEIHLSDINTREEFRKWSYPSLYCEKTIAGKGFQGYIEGLEYLVEKYSK
ncbi:MAG: type II 3-dehydroquinate dehydratase [Tissierellia bacterium]|nr:type II 3-dehydroquinate dehydratase [Tissierellia bacterium]